MTRISRPRGRNARPTLEGLEDRLLLFATNGGLWTYPVRVTYSIVPDGTVFDPASNVTSTLSSTLAGQGLSSQSWQDAIRKAAATWESVANVNLVQVSDDGSAFAASGNQQGDSRFGDIRIGGIPLSSGTLAMAFLPPPINGGTLAGDILFNTNQSWQLNADTDLTTVAIHEFGHALGMDHSAITTADMYAYYNGMKQTLTTDDTSGLQSIYGARQPDMFDTPTANNTYTAATQLTSRLNAQGQFSTTGLDITTAGDQDWFYVTAPASTSSTLTITVQSTNLSSMSPKLTVMSSALKLLASTSAPDAFGATITATVPNVTPGQGFYFNVQSTASTNTSPTRTGAYGLIVNFSSTPMGPLPPPITTVASQPNQGGGSSGLSTGASSDLSVGMSLPPWLAAPGSLPGNGTWSGLASAQDDTIHMQVGAFDGWADALTIAPPAAPAAGPTWLPPAATAGNDAAPVFIAPPLAIDGALAAWSPADNATPGPRRGH